MLISCVLQILSEDPEAYEGEETLVNCFQKLFGSQSCPSLPKFNDFSNFISYFVQKVGIAAAWVAFQLFMTHKLLIRRGTEERDA